MPSTQQFRKRIRSIKNTSQITKAMEMIASVKMQKAIRTVASARSYTQNAWAMLTTLAEMSSSKNHPLLQKREVKRSLLIIAGADRGLCGSYNSDLGRKVVSYIKNNNSVISALSSVSPASSSVIPAEAGILGNKIPDQVRDDKDKRPEAQIDVVAAGKKAAELAKKLGLNLVAEFPSFELDVEFWESRPVSKFAIESYIKGDYDKVDMVYSHFVSTLKQTPAIKQLLPIDRHHIDLPELWGEIQGEDSLSLKNRPVEMTNGIDYKFEPNTDEILERILPQFIRAVVYGLFLESNASEHSARMFAMKNATDNARDLIDDLTLTYNSIRQDSITKELAEIAGAAEAMK